MSKIESQGLNTLMNFFTRNISKGTLCINTKGRIVTANDKANEIFTTTLKINDKTTIFDFIPDMDETAWKKLLIKLRQRQSTHLKIEFPTTSDIPLITDASICMYNHLEQEFVFLIINHVEYKNEDRCLVQCGTEKENDYNFNEIISVSKSYKKVLSLAGIVATTDATVLLLGESGTGKELLSRAIHRLSFRNQAPFIKINCATLSENLLESELFGHEKGSFTGATNQRKGKFEIAHTGTIFLDEIGEMPIRMQAKLLRVIQEREFSRLGGNEVLKTDVRIIVATNRNLKKMVRKGKFREDLYYRLNVFPIENIPLRKRPEDIPVLSRFFVQRFSKKLNKPEISIADSDLEKLTKHNFPGNVRELENLIERAVILTSGNQLNLSFFEKEKQNIDITKNKAFKTFEEVQKECIIKALKKTKWKVSGEDGAAELLALHGQTLQSKMRKFKIFKKDYLK